MPKVLKYLLIALAALLAVLAAAAAYIAATFNPNDYKPQLVELVQQKTQRTLAIPGEIRLTFFPRIGADLGQISLSERKSEQRFASAEQVQVSVALLPLFSKQVVVDQVRVDGLNVRLRHGKDGRSNYDDLIPRGRDGAAAATPAPEASGPAPLLDVGGISVTNTRLSFQDEASGQKLSVSDLTLQTGPIAQGRSSRLEFGARIEGEKPQLALQLRLDAGFTPDLQRRVVVLDNLQASVNGRAAGLQELQFKLGALTLELSPTHVRSDTLALEASLASASGPISAKLGTGLEGDLAARRFVLEQLRAELQMPNPGGGLMALQAQGQVTADLGREQVQARLGGQLDSTRLDLQAGLRRFARPAVDFDLTLGELDVDRYLPKTAATQAAPASSPASAGGSAQPVDLSALNALDARGKLKIGSLRVAGLKASDIRLDLALANGRADISPLAATLYGGKLAGALSASASQPQRLGAKLDLQGIDIGPLLKDALDQQPLDGRGNVALDVTTRGADVAQFKRGLNGTASVLLRDGAINGINLAATLRKVKAKLGGGTQEGRAAADEKTDFTEFAASLRIKDGVAHNDDLSAKTPLLRLGGAGDIFLAEDRLDYTVKATVVPTLQGQGGPELEQLKGLTIPVRLSGPYTALGWKIDLAALAGSRAKAVTEERKQEIQQKVDEGKAKLEQRLKDEGADKLKNLLRR